MCVTFAWYNMCGMLNAKKPNCGELPLKGKFWNKGQQRSPPGV
jgi:hypothetical protein